MKIINLSVVLLVLNQPNVAGLASDRAFAPHKFPVECVGDGILAPKATKTVRANKIFSEIERLVQQANEQSRRGKYLQAKSNFAKAVASFDQAQRKDPKGFAPHLADHADCIEGYAKILRHLKQDARFWDKRVQALRQNLGLKNLETRKYSNGYPDYQPTDE